MPNTMDECALTVAIDGDTSGHLSSSIDPLSDGHCAAVSQAICDYRRDEHITGPLFVGLDVHVLAESAWHTAIEVFDANGVTVVTDRPDRITPVSAISRAIVRHNYGGSGAGMADGVLIMPSPDQLRGGGLTYRGVDGGPASTAATASINQRTDDLIAGKLRRVKRVSSTRGISEYRDLLGDYIDELGGVVDVDAIRRAGVPVGVEPLGGVSSQHWDAIAERHDLDITVAAGEEAISPDGGLGNPNHYLATAVDYLLGNRPAWSPYVAVGKSVVATSMIDHVAAERKRTLVEVPVGFGWFAPGLISGRLMFAGDNSGATCLRSDGSPWTTDRDGITMALLAAEILAVTGETPSQRYEHLAGRHGWLSDGQTEIPATPEASARAALLSIDDVTVNELAGDPIDRKTILAAGNGRRIGGVKVMTAAGWFVARPSERRSGVTIHAESSRGAEHVADIQAEAAEIVIKALDR